MYTSDSGGHIAGHCSHITVASRRLGIASVEAERPQATGTVRASESDKWVAASSRDYGGYYLHGSGGRRRRLGEEQGS